MGLTGEAAASRTMGDAQRPCSSAMEDSVGESSSVGLSGATARARTAMMSRGRTGTTAARSGATACADARSSARAHVVSSRCCGRLRAGASLTASTEGQAAPVVAVREQRVDAWKPAAFALGGHAAVPTIWRCSAVTCSSSAWLVARSCDTVLSSCRFSACQRTSEPAHTHTRAHTHAHTQAR